MNSATQNCVNLGNQKYQLLQFTLLEYQYFCHLPELYFVLRWHTFKLKHFKIGNENSIFICICHVTFLAHVTHGFCGVFLEENTEEWNNHSLLLWNNTH